MKSKLLWPLGLVVFYAYGVTGCSIDAQGNRGGSGNSDSVISGSLASAKPPRGGDTKERGNEEDETEPRSDL